MNSSLVLMVEPVSFAMNQETSNTNVFQHESSLSDSDVQKMALLEFHGVVEMLRTNGIRVHVIPDIKADQTPDSIFPNNWVSFHRDGRVVLYPMQANNRRRERRLPFILDVVNQHNLNLHHIIDLSFYEQYGKFLEGTGSIVFDHKNKLAYACKSERMHEEVLHKLCTILGYKPIVFSALDQHGTPIYHTNVMMAIADKFVVVCKDSVKSEWSMLQDSFIATGKTIIEISHLQMNNFCGNVLELFDKQGNSVLAMSSSAFNNFTPSQKEILSQYTKLAHVDIPTIQQCGGGSIRCMICQVELPQK